MVRSRSTIERFSFGGRVPGGLGLVLALTVITSLAVAFGDRHALELFELTPLVPARVLRGEVWRVVTWVLIEPAPLSLIFRCLLLYWLGRDLCGLWGSRRFLAVYFGTCVFAAIVTCLLSLVDPGLREQTYLGSWALDAAITVAWGLHFPTRVIRIYFVIPIRGYWLAWGSVGLTVVYAIYSGWQGLAPVLAAEGGMLAWIFRKRLQARWLKMQLAAIERKKAAAPDDDVEPLTAAEEAALRRSLERRPPKSNDLN